MEQSVGYASFLIPSSFMYHPREQSPLGEAVLVGPDAGRPSWSIGPKAQIDGHFCQMSDFGQ